MSRPSSIAATGQRRGKHEYGSTYFDVIEPQPSRPAPGHRRPNGRRPMQSVWSATAGVSWGAGASRINSSARPVFADASHVRPTAAARAPWSTMLLEFMLGVGPAEFSSGSCGPAGQDLVSRNRVAHAGYSYALNVRQLRRPGGSRRLAVGDAQRSARISARRGRPVQVDPQPQPHRSNVVAGHVRQRTDSSCTVHSSLLPLAQARSRRFMPASSTTPAPARAGCPGMPG